MQLLKWAVFFASLFLSISGLAQCTSGTQNGVTVVCDRIYSTHRSPLAGEPSLNYDLYYPTAYGADNTLPIIVFWHGGGYRTLTDKETNGSAVFSAVASMGFDVYIPSYSLTAMGKLNSSLCATCWLIPLGMDYNNWNQYFPTSASPNYTLKIDNEVIGPVYQQASTGSSYNLWAKRSGVAHSAGAFVYVQGTQWPRPGNDGARFLAFLGRDAGQVSGVPGNPHDIRLWGFSAGGHLTLMQVMSGSSLFVDDGEFSLADFNNARITRAAAMSPATDWSCAAILGGSGTAPDYEAALLGAVPHAQSVSKTNCAVTDPDATYLRGLKDSPVSLISPSNPDIPVLILTGDLDVVVTPESATEFMERAPNTKQIVYPNWGHALDLFTYHGGKMSMQSQAVQAMVNFIR